MIMKIFKTYFFVIFCVLSVMGNAQTIDSLSLNKSSSEKLLNTYTAKQLDSIQLRQANMEAMQKMASDQRHLESIEKRDSIKLREENIRAVRLMEIRPTLKAIAQEVRKVDSMNYRIDRHSSREDLKALALKVNKEHTAVLAYNDLQYDNNDEIIGIELKLIDSRLRESTYKVVPGSLMMPLTIYEYPDGRSGIKPIAPDSANEPIPQAVLDRIAAQEAAAKERETLKDKRATQQNTPEANTSPEKIKILVRSSATVPEKLLTKEQQELRDKKKDN